MSEDATGNEYRQQRIENMNRLAAAGYPPFGRAFERTARLDELHDTFVEGRPVKVCGRIVAIRKMGRMAFAHISDGSARFQLMLKKDELGDEAFAAFKLLDLGDIIGAEGELFITQTEEQTVRASRWSLLAKALLPLAKRFSHPATQSMLGQLSDTNGNFLRWAGLAVLRWDPDPDGWSMPVHQIHGNRDRVLPHYLTRPDVLVPGAGHLLPLTHPQAVNDFLEKNM